MKDKNQGNACSAESCGCSKNQIWLRIAVIIIVMVIAVIFGN